MLLRAGIIGIASFYSRAYASALLEIKEAEIVAATHLGQTDESLGALGGLSRQEYADRFGVCLYAQAEEMLAKEHLDLVCVCAKNDERPRYTELAAKAGAHVFLAKPMCASLEGADRIVRVAQATGVLMSACSPQPDSTGPFVQRTRRSEMAS